MSRPLVFGQRRGAQKAVFIILGLLTLAGMAAIQAVDKGQEEQVVKTEQFDRDPGWEGFNNRIVPGKQVTVRQDFGYRPSNIAGKTAGEMGGAIWRSTTPAYYADRIANRTLEDKLTASGTFALTATSTGSGLFFGWFDARTLGSGRNRNTLGWYLDAENAGARLYANLVTGTNRSHGDFVTPFTPGVKDLHLRPDDTRHTWTFMYDPQGNGGNGTITFTLDKKAPVVVEFPPGFKKEGATFNRFGLMNIQKGGGPLTLHVDDLHYEGKVEDFSQDPGWESSGNQVSFEDREQPGAHQFGFSDTHFAGDTRGEVGGTFWPRTEEPFAYYADRVNPLTFNDKLVASGKVAFTIGSPDSGVFLGWFNNKGRNDPPKDFRNFVGVYLEGPSRIGHYFRPYYATGKGERGDPQQGPLITPDGKKRSWTLKYDPHANGGKGTVHVTLDGESFTLNLQPGHKAQGAAFDRFGLLTARTGGGHVKVYVDDLKYTAGKRAN